MTADQAALTRVWRLLRPFESAVGALAAPADGSPGLLAFVTFLETGPPLPRGDGMFSVGMRGVETRPPVGRRLDTLDAALAWLEATKAELLAAPGMGWREAALDGSARD